ncbi:Beta-galactosidase/beta-glucuronidase [Pedobacter westerhofensis]|uniref:beta-galactosidase n=1 Tax=Pedobacter westerhofensis TaxID=425512 RepID=A0A521FL18_9SPHI|nr:glycoside hydrolase family 2 TIM barrel-domain containing protein [Pedobacter westerhofensis]SMO96754.1 Beta-galactosidase/beta-glucuronidase [Pedobacter westerhofensis]
MKTISLLFVFFFLLTSSFAQQSIVKYLSGTDKDHTVLWDFYCSEGRKSGVWTKIPVPSQWKTHGFGNYNYGHDKLKAKEQGIYKTSFLKAAAWKDKRIFIVFEGAMRDTKVMLNGKQAGEVHQGSFYRFKYDVTDLIKSGKNQLEVIVDKVSANASVNKAENGDFWIFGGIYRPVYLEITPQTFIDRIAINATADGVFNMDVYAQNLKGNEIIEGQVQKLNGEKVGKLFSVTVNPVSGFQQLRTVIDKPLNWSAEYPNLYKVVVHVKQKGLVLHSVGQNFGFRTVELRKNDGIYVNNKKIVLKGVNRHSFWPETGRTLNHAIHMMDVKAMKDMNMNAVRMSHYPPDQDFLAICDSLGLYVLDELTGWQANYDTVVGRKLVKEVVVRDVNHPSILFWDNGNEGGFNRDLDNDYKLYDPQNRVVLHPWEKFNGSNTKHYPDYNYVANTLPKDKDGGVFFPTEFMHGLYDGGAGAGLEDFWNAMNLYPANAGGFIWVLGDESLIRRDKNNAYDSDGNHAPDGILGPHREKEASYFTIKELWWPVYLTPQAIDAGFDGLVPVENRYAFTNLNACTFKWELVKFPSAAATTTAAKIIRSGVPAPLDLAPGAHGFLDFKLPAGWAENDALYLTAYDRNKQVIFTWSWPITPPAAISKTPKSWVKMPVTAIEKDRALIIQANRIKYYFDKTTGYITKVVKPNSTVSLSGGPVLAGDSATLKQFRHTAENGSEIIEADYEGNSTLHVKWTFTWDKPAKLEYSYKQKGDVDFHGISFNYPEEKVKGVKWLGRGPYKVWKNRLRGQQFGVWQKDYNNSITGESWKYPEFKGYHAEVYWITIENQESPFTVYTDDKDTFVQLYHQDRANATLNRVEPPMPKGDISFLKGISAIGTKFQEAKDMGPQSQKNSLNGDAVTGTLWFDF